MPLSSEEQKQFSEDFFIKYPEKKPQMAVPPGSVDVDETNAFARNKFLDWEKRISERHQ